MESQTKIDKLDKLKHYYINPTSAKNYLQKLIIAITFKIH
jgi:hypothetical protein